jgi:hypothetical protein
MTERKPGTLASLWVGWTTYSLLQALDHLVIRRHKYIKVAMQAFGHSLALYCVADPGPDIDLFCRILRLCITAFNHR